MSGAAPWEWDEDAIIRRDFPIFGAAPLAGEKLDRTAHQIRRRAAFLGVIGPDKPIIPAPKRKEVKRHHAPLPQERPQAPLTLPTPPTPAEVAPPARPASAVEPCARSKPQRGEPNAPVQLVRRLPRPAPPVEHDPAFLEQCRLVAAGKLQVKEQRRFTKSYGDISLTGCGSAYDS